MKFRPCIDLHHGQVKQIVGSTLSDSASDTPSTNFSTERPASDYAKMYQRDELTGGHVIMLGPGNTEAVRYCSFRESVVCPAQNSSSNAPQLPPPTLLGTSSAASISQWPSSWWGYQ